MRGGQIQKTGLDMRVPFVTSSAMSVRNHVMESHGYAARVMVSTDGLALVRVSGRVDFCTAADLLAKVNSALRSGARSVHIDLARVTFFGAIGPCVLLTAKRHCRQLGAVLVITRPSRPVVRALQRRGIVSSILERTAL